MGLRQDRSGFTAQAEILVQIQRIQSISARLWLVIAQRIERCRFNHRRRLMAGQLRSSATPADRPERRSPMDLSPSDPQAIAYVDLGGMFVLLNNGDTLPITNMFDADGDECEAADAVTVVAGADGLGWWSVPLEFVNDERLN